MDYDYLSSIVSNYTNLSSLTNKASSALSGVSSATDAMSAISATNSFSSVLDAAMQSAGVNEETASELQSIAAVKTNSGIESEARSNLIMQNYLSAAIMQDTLQNSLTDSADFTSSLFSNLAVGSTDENSGSSSMLGSLQQSTLSAISNLSSYQQLLDNTIGDDDYESVAAALGSALGESSTLNNLLSGDDDNALDRISDNIQGNSASGNDTSSISELAASLGLTGLTGSSMITGLNNISDLADSFGLSGLSGLSELGSAV